ncbi:MAG: TetR family transcriptional regulator [Thermomicrobiales bacterium]
MKSHETVRRRDSVATRQALLDAARELFGSKGYDGTSLREIGERAGVDASLIARYFGNKVALYSATLQAEGSSDDGSEDRTDVEALVRRLLLRVESRGLGPLLQALSESDVDPDIRQTAREHMQRRVLGPLEERMRREGVGMPDLRADILLATVLGVMTIRSTSSLDVLAGAEHEDVVEILRPALNAIVGRSATE